MKSVIVAVTLLATAAIAKPYNAHQRHHHEKRAYVTEIDNVVCTETLVVDPVAKTTKTVHPADADCTSTVEAQFTAAGTAARHGGFKHHGPSFYGSGAPPSNPPQNAAASVSSTSSIAPTVQNTVASVSSSSSYETPATTLVSPVPAISASTESAQAISTVAQTTFATSVMPPVVSTPTPNPPSDSGSSGSSCVGVVPVAGICDIENHPSTASGKTGVNMGDLTMYDPSVSTGSCGKLNSKSDLVVAVTARFFEKYTDMSGNPNFNEICNTQVEITIDGKTATATVVDTCAGPNCLVGDLDASPGVWRALGVSVGDNDTGTRYHGMKWHFV